jgi:hypothetical protein
MAVFGFALTIILFFTLSLGKNASLLFSYILSFVILLIVRMLQKAQDILFKVAKIDK